MNRSEDGKVSVTVRVRTKNGYLDRPAKSDGLLALKFKDWDGVLQEIPADVSFDVVPLLVPMTFL